MSVEFKRSKIGRGVFRHIDEPGRFEFAYWSDEDDGWVDAIHITGYWLLEANEAYTVTADEARETIGNPDDLMADAVRVLTGD